MSRTAMKAVFIGGAGTGKTAFCHRLLRDTFSSSYYATFGAEVSDKDFQTSGEHKWQLWDLSGQERYQEMLAFYLRRSRAVLIFVDATCPVKSIDELSGFENIPQDALCTVIFTKSDNERALEFTEETYLSYVKRVQNTLGISEKQFKTVPPYFVTSAKAGDDINEAMAAIETAVLSSALETRIDFELSYHKLLDQTPPSLEKNHNDFTYKAFFLHAKNMMNALLSQMQEQHLSHADRTAYEMLYDLLQQECIAIGCQSRTLEESLKAEEPYLMQLKRKAFYTGSHQNCIAYEEAFLARPTDSSQTINMNAPYQPSQQLIQRLINSQNYQRVSSAFARVEHRIQGRNPDATSFLERLKDLILYKLSTLFRKKQIKSHPLYFARLFAQKATCRTAAEQTARAVIPSDRSPGITA